MKNVGLALFVASSIAIGTAAQGPEPAPPAGGQQPAAQGQQQKPAAPAEKPAAPAAQQQGPAKITISGCIESPSPAAAAPGGGPPATTPAAAKFELANAKVVSGGPVGTAGTASAATRYRLEGEEKTIAPHLNHQVEITGTSTPAAATGPAGAPAAPMLKVESVKMISAKCGS